MSATKSRPSPALRRLGYLGTVVAAAVFLLAINVWPGWRPLPFLTEDTLRVIGLVNLSLVAGIVVNLGYTLVDPPWVRALGDLVTTGIGILVLIRIMQVFPFDFGDSASTWDAVTRLVIIAFIAVSALALLVHAVQVIRFAIAPEEIAGDGPSTRNERDRTDTHLREDRHDAGSGEDRHDATGTDLDAQWAPVSTPQQRPQP